MNLTKVSVIVPVFNAAKYIEQCINSIRGQSLNEIEIIIVNDGSTDDSKKLITDLAKKDDRIVFIDNLNQGVGAARNKGLKVATGEYVGFVDADDWINPVFYETMYTKAISNKCDWAICNVNEVEDEINTKVRLKLNDEIIFLAENRDKQLHNFLSFKYDYANWNKIYSLNIVREFSLLFHEKMTIWEDLLFNLYYIHFSKKVIIIKEPLYQYRIHTASVMKNPFKNISNNYNLLYDSFISFCKRNEFYREEIVFKKERSDTWRDALIYFINLAPRKKNAFWNLFTNFKREVSALNRDIYLYKITSGYSGKNFYDFLLENRFLALFSFLFTANLTIKANLRKLIKG